MPNDPYAAFSDPIASGNDPYADIATPIAEGAQPTFKTQKMKVGDKTLDFRPDDKAFYLHEAPKGPGWYFDPLGKNKAPDAPMAKGKTLEQKFGDFPLMEAALGSTSYGVMKQLLGDRTPNPTPASIRQGIVNVPMAVGQLGALQADIPGYVQSKITGKPFKSSPVSKSINEFVTEDRARTERKYSDPNDALGNMTGAAMVPIPIPGASQGAGIATKLGVGALHGAITAPLTMPVIGAENMTPAEIAWEKAKQSAGGAAIGGVISGVAQGAPAGLRRILGTKAEREAALARAERMRVNTRTIANPAGVEPSLAQATGSPNLEKLEKITEWTPLSGKAKDLKTQNEGLALVTKEMADKTAPALGLGGVGPEVSASAERTLLAKKADIAPMYKYVRDSVGDSPTANVNRLAAYDKAISDASGLFGKDSATVSELMAERAKIANREVGNTFSELEKIQDIHQNEAYKGAVSQSKTERILSRYDKDIARATGEDMHATVADVDKTGFLSDVYRKANERTQQEVHPFDPMHAGDWQNKGRQQVNKLLHGQEGREGKGIIGLLKQNDPEVAKHAANALDKAGHDAIEAQIFKNIDDAYSDSKIGSPAKAAEAIRKHSAFIKEFMSPEKQATLKGIENAMEAMKRSGQYLAQMENGQMVIAGGRVTAIGPALALAAQGHPGTLAAEGVGMALSKLYTKLSGTKAGKNWLLGASKTTPRSVEMGFLMKKLPQILESSPRQNEPTQTDEVTE